MAKQKFAKSMFSRADSSKQTWQAINRLNNRSRKNAPISESLADELNSSFGTFFRSPDVDTTHFSFLDDFNPPSSFQISEFEVFKELKKIKSSSSGHDLIKGWVLKRYVHEIALPLSVIFNRCLQECSFPSAWKLATIIPLPKGKSDFRPISLLPCASKVLERLFVKKFFVPALKSSFNRFQFGFLPTTVGGCCNAVTYARLYILRHLALTDGYVRMVHIDFHKAFDRASHSAILSALSSLVYSKPWMLKFLHSYLSNRSQRVRASSGYVSPWLPCTSGVPQGSVIGPLLFALLINNFPSLGPNSKLIAYADDLILLHHVDSSSTDNLQHEIMKIVDWTSQVRLDINVSKFKSITFSRKPVAPSNLNLHGVTISNDDHLKFLGIIFQSNTKWDSHVSSIIRKASRNMFLVKTLWFHKTPSDIIWQAYLAFVFSIISYCYPSFCDIPISALKKFSVIEKRACRWADRSFSHSCFVQRLEDSCVRLITKVASLKSFHPLSDFFLIRPPSSTLRRSRILLVENIKKSFYRNSFVKFSSES